MEEYNYKAITQSGETVAGSISGDSYPKVMSQLEQDGLQPFYLKRADKIDNKKVEKGSDVSSFSFSFNKHNDIMLFTKQLANLLQAGIQLNEALSVIIGLFKESIFKNIIIDIHHSLKEGRSFASSLGKYSRYFNSTYISMVKAGEESGYLPLICNRIADDMEESHRLRSFIISSMIYPVILIIVSTLAVITILLFVLPKFINIYDTYDKSLPLPTVILLNISNFINQNGLIILSTIIILIFLVWYYIKTEQGRENIDAFKLKIPILGNLLRKLAVSRITGGLGILVGNGVPLLKSLNIIKEVTGNSIYYHALKKISKKVERGITLSQALDSTGVFPDLAVYLVGVGEQTGELGSMLKQVGEGMTTEYKEGLERFLKFFEPVVLLCMGLIIGFIVFAMLLPVMRINTIL